MMAQAAWPCIMSKMRMTEIQWREAMARIESLRFQLVNNIMPMLERQDMRAQLVAALRQLAKQVELS